MPPKSGRDCQQNAEESSLQSIPGEDSESGAWIQSYDGDGAVRTAGVKCRSGTGSALVLGLRRRAASLHVNSPLFEFASPSRLGAERVSKR